MKYRVIEEEFERIVITSNGGIGTVRSAEPLLDGGTRKSLVEWYSTITVHLLESNLLAVIKCPDEDLPKYLNDPDESVQDVIRTRLKGFEPESFSYYVWDWLSNYSHIYSSDSDKPYDHKDHIDLILYNLTGRDSEAYERDDTLFKEHF